MFDMLLEMFIKLEELLPKLLCYSGLNESGWNSSEKEMFSYLLDICKEVDY